MAEKSVILQVSAEKENSDKRPE
ncbi:hypothetical protein ES1_08220 [[Eubacterium] siraeum V10Sc8a]|uniref:Uncharacterized protein n=1 Tax=[Eubacterium] siraeum V10Sc8a TaxID=717961 RepID=D4MJH2_9FIRM|nr:hypothetical protein ES1_08220 [[Eubacterium] siraeum V10Sc8a]